MQCQYYTLVSLTQISSEDEIIQEFPQFPNIPENVQYSHKIPQIYPSQNSREFCIPNKYII